jgi:large subunit ribosomal protein L6
MAFPGEVRLTQVEGGISFAQAEKTRQAQMMVGTARSLVANMIEGVISGFSKQLEITGVGFKAARNEGFLDLSLGTSHPLRYTIPEGVQVSVADGTKLTVSGIDKQKVGQVAADIYSFSPVEPYKGKGVRIVGKFVRRKEGKKTA